MIKNAGELVAYIQGAVEQNGANPRTEIHVRIGKMGPTYTMQGLTGVRDERGLRLLLELDPLSAVVD